jgi:hypothetical protein
LRSGLIFGAVLCLLITCSQVKNFPLTREEAWKIVADELPISKGTEVKVYALASSVRGGTAISTWGREILVPKELNEAWFFFIDDAPMANWEHPCRYAFIDFQTALIKVIDSTRPPDNLDQMDKIFPQKKS